MKNNGDSVNVNKIIFFSGTLQLNLEIFSFKRRGFEFVQYITLSFPKRENSRVKIPERFRFLYLQKTENS